MLRVTATITLFSSLHSITSSKAAKQVTAINQLVSWSRIESNFNRAVTLVLNPQLQIILVRVWLKCIIIINLITILRSERLTWWKPFFLVSIKLRTRSATFWFVWNPFLCTNSRVSNRTWTRTVNPNEPFHFGEPEPNLNQADKFSLSSEPR